MTSTPNLGLPFIESAQAQKHVTHNEALQILDATVQIAVLDVTRTTPPPTPFEGQRHVIGASPGDVWTGHALAVAIWQDGAWAFLGPKTGWCVWSVADARLLVFDGTLWRALDQLPQFGINTSADGDNRLSVKSNAVLLSHDDATPGSGDLRLTLNKAAAGNDAGIALQSNYATHALLGLLGDDNLAVKVSADGVSYRTALAIDKASGQVGFAQSPKFLAYMNFDKYCAANTFTKVQFNNVRHNDQVAFDGATNQFVAPVAGIYALGFRVMFKANAALPTTLTAAFYKNGAELADDSRVQTSSALVSNKTVLSCNTVLSLAAADTIAVWAAMETNDGYIAAAQNGFYGHRIG